MLRVGVLSCQACFKIRNSPHFSLMNTFDQSNQFGCRLSQCEIQSDEM